MMAVLAIGALLTGAPAPTLGDEASGPVAAPAPPPSAPAETVVIGRRDDSAPREDRTGAASVVRPTESPRAFDDLGSILLEVPGVTATRTGSIGSYTTISIRGSSPDEVRIYLDGVPMNIASGGAVDISTLPLGDVDRVEVYRGTSPLAFGASALGGIVSITTRTPAETKLDARGGVASFATRFVDLTGGGRLGPLRLYAGVHGISAAGDYRYHNDNGTAANPTDDVDMPRQNNDLREVNGVVRAELPLAGRRTLSLGGIGFLREQGLPGLGAYPTMRARQATERGVGYLRYQSRDDLGAGGQLSARVYASDQRDRTDDPDGELGVGGPSLTYNTTQALGAIADGSRPVTEWLRVGGVVEGRRETYAPENALGTVPVGVPARRLAGVTGAELTVYWRQANLDIVSSARLETVNDIVTDGATAAPAVTRQMPVLRLGLDRPLGAHAMVKANLGRYGRVPSFIELYGNGTGRLLGNADLEPERGTNADVALWVDRGGVSSRSGLFGRLVDDLIQWQATSWGQARAANLARARIWGAEQELRLALGRHFRAVAQLTYLHAMDESDNAASHGRQLPFHPRYAGYLRPELLAVPLPLGMELAGYADADLRGQTYADRANLLALGARVIVGAGLSVRLPREGLRLTASAVNLTDDRHADFTDWALPGRTLFLAFAYTPLGAAREGGFFDPRHGP